MVLDAEEIMTEIGDVLIEAFKDGWAEADQLGRDGHRVETGLLNALEKLNESYVVVEDYS